MKHSPYLKLLSTTLMDVTLSFAGALESERNADRGRSSIHGFTNIEYKRKGNFLIETG